MGRSSTKKHVWDTGSMPSTSAPEDALSVATVKGCTQSSCNEAKGTQQTKGARAGGGGQCRHLTTGLRETERERHHRVRGPTWC
jgi:hypothetical protein